ncbi:hypothetical protein BV22DRAFT_1041966 [Leucogyrophana mollusca]|uniref:Uncharacterized protein n=1 Tax=Leucogyrophana mollusca TaxID=85980 RepID=A0ACB8AZ64_9AGAM|nr:hypothetical protein BV22DRAFT_1041966 [Leucogyrophana mollusca]
MVRIRGRSCARATPHVPRYSDGICPAPVASAWRQVQVLDSKKEHIARVRDRMPSLIGT